MTIGAFVCLIVALCFAGGGLLAVRILNMDAGQPNWQAIKELYWPFAVAAVVMLIGAYQSQSNYWKQKRQGVTNGLPATMTVGSFVLIAGCLLLLISVKWLYELFSSKYSRYGMTTDFVQPLILLALGIFCLWGFGKLKKNK